MATIDQNGLEEGWFDWAYKGVDHTLPGNGGVECRDFLSVSQRCWESVIASAVAVLALIVAVPRLRLPWRLSCTYQKPEPVGKRLLLLLMCLTFGVELGFKLATRQMIWIGNPCHLATMMQIFILAAPPSRIVTSAFRLHMHMLTGAPIAILFPVINTRLLPFETGVYFLQHVLMLIIPFYLMKTGDPFIPEELFDFSWPMVSFGFLFIYHFLPLQLLAYVSQVNLNNMLCPAVSDPFHGKYYRLFAIAHQFILIPCQGKLFVLIAKAFGLLPADNPPDQCPAGEAVKSPSSNYCVGNNTCCSSNVSCESTASSAKRLDDYDDSGFLGAGCALGGKDMADSQVHDGHADVSVSEQTCGGCEETEEEEDEGVPGACSSSGEDQPMTVVRRLVNGRIVEDEHGRGGKGEGEGVGVDGSLAPGREESGCNPMADGAPPSRRQQSGQRSVNGTGKPLTMSDLETTRNGHAKMH